MDDNSYLPPKSFQGKAEPSQTKPMQSESRRHAVAQPRKVYRAEAAQPQRRRVATYRRHHSRERYAYNQPFPFFFGWFR